MGTAKFIRSAGMSCDSLKVTERPKMKINYSIDQQRRLILTTAERRVTFEDIRGHQDRLLADPDFDASFDQLIDTTTATRFDISPKEALILSERRMFSPTSRRAFVAADSQTFGLGLL